MKTLKIGKKLQNLGVTAFSSSVSLETIKVDSDNPYFKSVDNVLYDKSGKTLILCAATKDSVTIESTVTTLDHRSFADCKKLKKVTLPKSVSSLGNEVFINCVSMEAIYVSDDNPTFQSKNGCLITKNGTVFLEPPRGKKILKIPNSVTHIPNKAVCGSQASTVIMGDNVKYIGEKAFHLMSELEEISLASDVTEIGYCAFCYLVKIKKFCYFGKTDPGTVIFDYTGRDLVITVPPDYPSKIFCKKSVEKADSCTVEGQGSDSDSDPYHSSSSGIPGGSGNKNSVSGTEMKAIPSNLVIAVSAWLISTMFFFLF